MTTKNDAIASRFLVLIGALYLSQGVPMGLAFMALPAIMRSLGTSTETIGLLGVVVLPWAFKFLWAPYVDRLSGGPLGPRRSWIIPTQALCSLLFFIMALLVSNDQSEITLVIVTLMLINTISATQDIATDGLAVERLKGKQIIWVNGLQIGAFAAGMTIGGSLTIILYDNGGWRMAFIALGTIMLIPLIIAFFVKETPITTDMRSTPVERPSLVRTFRRPGALMMLSIAALFQFAHGMVGAMHGPFLVDAGLSLTQIGILSGTAMFVFAVIGSLIGSLIAARIGAPLTALIFGTMAAAALALWLEPALSMKITFQQALIISAVISTFVFAAYASFFTVLMQWASPDQAGTDFTVLQCAETLWGAIAAMLAGQIAGSFGFSGFFSIVLLIAILAMAWIGFSLLRLGRLRLLLPKQNATSQTPSAGNPNNVEERTT